MRAYPQLLSSGHTRKNTYTQKPRHLFAGGADKQSITVDIAEFLQLQYMGTLNVSINEVHLDLL
jgi:hypothetical protein